MGIIVAHVQCVLKTLLHLVAVNSTIHVKYMHTGSCSTWNGWDYVTTECSARLCARCL